MSGITCPACGTENPADAMNCKECRINLRFALENPAQAVSMSLALWRTRRPLLMPFLLWGPLALVQEGVTFSLGMLTPGGDAQWIVYSGISAPVIVTCGVVFLVLGMAGVSSLSLS